jgi:hypothetical protein
MGRRTDKKSQNQHWQQFVLDNLHRKNITADDIADDSQPYPDIDGKDYETAVAMLKMYLSPSGWKRLSERFRQFKARRTFSCKESGSRKCYCDHIVAGLAILWSLRVPVLAG